MTCFLQTWLCAVGPVHLVATDTALRAIVYPPMWAHFQPRLGDLRDQDTAVLAETRDQLTDYFAGRREGFDLPLDPIGTDFQRAAWTALQAIPYGETRTYTQQAAQIGRPTAVRAIGRANGLNPISIVVPCHRVIGGNGALTGYAGGLTAKAWLLAHEAGRRILS